MRLYSIGHSNRPLEDFLVLLAEHHIVGLADVRAFPASRRWPHFNREALELSLAEAGIRYLWVPELGGRRKPRQGVESRHKAWTVDSFRHYADYAESEDFARGLAKLVELGAAGPAAYMCAEALYWQCHRRLISDHLLLHSHEVVHIGGRGRAETHRLTPFARVVGGQLIYDGGTQLELGVTRAKP
jgi:uncharacterized protein (DUF488 family)